MVIKLAGVLIEEESDTVEQLRQLGWNDTVRIRVERYGQPDRGYQQMSVERALSEVEQDDVVYADINEVHKRR